MASLTVAQVLAKIKPTLDKARAIADKGNAAISKLDSTFAGKLVKLIPGAGPIVADIVAAAAVLTEVLDAVDTVVDANSAS